VWRNNFPLKDKEVSFRYILYQKETFYNTEKVIKEVLGVLAFQWLGKLQR